MKQKIVCPVCGRESISYCQKNAHPRSTFIHYYKCDSCNHSGSITDTKEKALKRFNNSNPYIQYKNLYCPKCDSYYVETNIHDFFRGWISTCTSCGYEDYIRKFNKNTKEVDEEKVDVIT